MAIYGAHGVLNTRNTQRHRRGRRPVTTDKDGDSDLRHRAALRRSHDKACIEECPVDCIYEGERMLYIHPDECVDCGACEPVCPVEAIFYEDDTPEQWKDYYKANVEFFDDLGSPGGAAKLGLIHKDHPLIEALPAAGPDGGVSAATRARPVVWRWLPVFPWDLPGRTPSSRRRHPGRHRRPVRRHAGRPHPGRGARGAARGRGRARLSATYGHRRRCARRCCRLARRATACPDLDPDGVLPTIGSKELVACCRPCSGLGPATVAIPELAYPTYDVGARLAGAEPVVRPTAPCRSVRRGVRLVWLNSPANPTGRVLARQRICAGSCGGPGHAARSSPATSAISNWGGTPQPVSVLHPEVCGGSTTGAARRALALEAVQPGGLPRRLRRR